VTAQSGVKPAPTCRRLHAVGLGGNHKTVSTDPAVGFARLGSFPASRNSRIGRPWHTGPDIPLGLLLAFDEQVKHVDDISMF